MIHFQVCFVRICIYLLKDTVPAISMCISVCGSFHYYVLMLEQDTSVAVVYISCFHILV